MSGHLTVPDGATAVVLFARGGGSSRHGPRNRYLAVVSRGGRPDLAGPKLREVRAPTLLIVGGMDHAVLDLNREAEKALACRSELAVVPGATHLFAEPGTLKAAAELARDWFGTHLAASAAAA